MERREFADGDGGSIGAMALAGAAVHWRRGACDVADRRSRNQSGDSGCGGDVEYSREKAARRKGVRKGFAGGTAKENVSDARDASVANGGAESSCQTHSGRHKAVQGPMGIEVDATMAHAAAHFAADCWRGIPAGAREG